jgi:2-oxoglutarate dehydrogenase complex dehydrogenase (E1) component-like enzyme
MERFGFIHEKLDISLGSFYIRGAFPAVSADTIGRAEAQTTGIVYFTTPNAYADLWILDMQRKRKRYLITEKGKRNDRHWRNSLPFSAHAKREAIAPISVRHAPERLD